MKEKQKMREKREKAGLEKGVWWRWRRTRKEKGIQQREDHDNAKEVSAAGEKNGTQQNMIYRKVASIYKREGVQVKAAGGGKAP